MNRLLPKQGGGTTSAPYVSPELTLFAVCVEQGFAASGPEWNDDPTVGGENPLDPYSPSSYENY